MKSSPSESERFFYHSFPRRARSDEERALIAGPKILAAIRDLGILLTPETNEWKELLGVDGNLSKSMMIGQVRCCFTELMPEELPKHAEDFGQFSVEFDVCTLRQLGCLPACYLPKPKEQGAGLEHIGSMLVVRLGEIQGLLELMTELTELVATAQDKSQILVHGENPIQCTCAGVEDLFQLLTRRSQSTRVLSRAIAGLSGLISPADDFEHKGPHGGLLSYYRQREWRIVAGIEKNGVAIHRELEPDEKDRLLQIDPEFFGKEHEFRGGNDRQIDRCRVFSEYLGKSIMRYARRVIVPERVLDQARDILSDDDDPEVVTIESLRNTPGCALGPKRLPAGARRKGRRNG
ncbi:MAG: hypothetical protein GY906_10840 [bacterium]|nr:hypothetical protein [bacterium]